MIRDKVQTKLAKAYNAKLSDAVRSFTGSREESGEYDPNDPTGSGTTINFEGRGVFGSYSVEEVDDNHILVTDTKLSGVLQNELVRSDDGSVFEPAVGDKVDGYEVVNVSQDPAKCQWVLQLRKT